MSVPSISLEVLGLVFNVNLLKSKGRKEMFEHKNAFFKFSSMHSSGKVEVFSNRIGHLSKEFDANTCITFCNFSCI
jgi:hypothetical protein